MQKIKSEQMFAVLFLLKLFWLLSTPRPFSSVSLAGALLSAGLQALLLLPVIAAGERGLPRSKLSAWVYGIFFILWGAKSLLRLLEVSGGVAFPMHSGTLGMLLLAAVCLYGAGLGLTALARASVLLFGVSLAALFVLLLGAYPAFDARELVTEDAGGLLPAAWQDFCDSGGLVAAAVLFGRAGGHPRRGVFAALAAQVAAIALVTILAAGVLGRLMNVAEYPFFTLCAFSQPFSVQRSDALFLLLFAALGVFAAAVPLCLAGELAETSLPCLGRRRLLVLAAAMLLCVWGMRALHIPVGDLSGVGCLLLVGIWPCRCFLRRRARQPS